MCWMDAVIAEPQCWKSGFVFRRVWLRRCCWLVACECLCLRVIFTAMDDFYPLSVTPLGTTSTDELVHAGDVCHSSLLTESPSSLTTISIKPDPADATVSASCFQDRDNGAVADSNSCGAGQQPFIACRVCGDKASGYHYGVTSCEGCKVCWHILLMASKHFV